MKPPNEEGRGEAPPGTAFDDPTAARGKPNASGKTSPESTVRQAKNCTTCHVEFVPARGYYRKCPDCAARFKVACMDLAKQRTRDGVVAFQLRERVHLLKTDDAEAALWLQSLIASKGDA